MSFDLEKICCDAASSSSSSTRIFCDNDHNKCNPRCCCHSCCRQSSLSDHTYEILKRICNKIFRNYNRQKCREKYTVFGGGNSIFEVQAISKSEDPCNCGCYVKEGSPCDVLKKKNGESKKTLVLDMQKQFGDGAFLGVAETHAFYDNGMDQKAGDKANRAGKQSNGKGSLEKDNDNDKSDKGAKSGRGPENKSQQKGAVGKKDTDDVQSKSKKLNDGKNDDKILGGLQKQDKDNKVKDEKRGSRDKAGKTNRGSKANKSDKNDSGNEDKGGNGDEANKGGKGDKGDKSDKGNKDKKGRKSVKDDKGNKGDKDDKNDIGDTAKKHRPSEKDDKANKGDKGDKVDKSDKNDKGDKSDKDKKGRQSEKGNKSDKDDKGNKGNKDGKGEKNGKIRKSSLGALALGRPSKSRRKSKNANIEHANWQQKGENGSRGSKKGKRVSAAENLPNRFDEIRPCDILRVELEGRDLRRCLRCCNTCCCRYRCCRYC